MNCLIENDYIRELSPPKKSPMYSRMNCLIENDYIKGTFKKKITYVFTNELPNWKRILKGKNGKKREKTVGVLYYGGGLLFWTGSWRTLLWGGLLIPCWHYICEPPSKSIADAWYENIGYRFFCGALSHLSLYSVLFKSTLNNAKMQRNWLHGFRSLSCRDWIKGRSLSLRLPSCWGAI